MGNFIELERRGFVAIVRMNNEPALNAIGSHEDCEDFVKHYSRSPTIVSRLAY